MKKELNNEELKINGGQTTVSSTIIHRDIIVFKKACPICGNIIPLNEYDEHIKMHK